METTETTQPSLDGFGFSSDFVIVTDEVGAGPEATINERWYRLYSHSKAMCELMLAFNTELEPGYAPQGLGVAVHDQLSKLENLVSAARILITPAIAATGEWKREGAANPEGWFAGKTGKSRAKARADMETGKNLGNAPGTREAFLNGELSAEQADTISDVAEVNPEAEQDLLEAAKKQSLKELKDEAARRKAEVEDMEERERRLHKKRYLRTWTDSEGAWHLHARGPVPTGADFQSVLERLIDQQFKQARKNGVRGTRDNYAFDALMKMWAQHGFGFGDPAPTGATTAAPHAAGPSPAKPSGPTSPSGRAATGPASPDESNGRTVNPGQSKRAEPAVQTGRRNRGERPDTGEKRPGKRDRGEVRNVEENEAGERSRGEGRSGGAKRPGEPSRSEARTVEQDEPGEPSSDNSRNVAAHRPDEASSGETRKGGSRKGGTGRPGECRGDGENGDGGGESRAKPKRPAGPTSGGAAKHPAATPEDVGRSAGDAGSRQTPRQGAADEGNKEGNPAELPGAADAGNKERGPALRPGSADAAQERANAEPSGEPIRPRRPPVSQQQIYCIDWDALVRGSARTGERCELRGVAPVSVLTVRAALASSSAKLVVTDDDGRVVTVAHLGTGPINLRLIPGLGETSTASPTLFDEIRGAGVADSLSAGLAGRPDVGPESASKTVIIRVRGRSLLDLATGNLRADERAQEGTPTATGTDTASSPASPQPGKIGPTASESGAFNIAGLGEVSRDRVLRTLGAQVMARLATRGEAVRLLVHTGRAPNAAQRIALAWADTTCSVEGCPNQRVEIDHRSPWASERTTQLDNLDPLCVHHHGQKSAQDAARRTGTARR